MASKKALQNAKQRKTYIKNERPLFHSGCKILLIQDDTVFWTFHSAVLKTTCNY